VGYCGDGGAIFRLEKEWKRRDAIVAVA